jgi:hypothetical protein
MHPGRKAVYLTLLFQLAALGTAAAAAPPGAVPWEAQPFAGDPGEVLAAGRAATAGATADVVVLLEEGLYTFDEQGRCDYRYRLVYVVRTEAGARGWDSIDGVWAPWHEERPVLRARVVTPEGQAFVLDPKTIGEVPLSDDDPDLLTDRKRLRAPLPGLKVGAVVEEEVRSVDRQPFFAAGTQYRFYLGNDVPTRRVRVVVDAPESLPLHHALRGTSGLTLEREREGGRVRLRLEAGPLDPAPAFEPWMPSDRPRAAFLAFSTGASWTAVADTYGRIVDAQIGIASPATLRKGVRREEVAARLLRALRAEVRYTGLEFGEAAIVPRSPAEVVARKYGDCKDQAALLLSRLRGEGIPAHVALLSTGPGADVEPGLPGIGGFDHAIVVVPGDPPLWIDPTDDFSRVGELPVSDQDRLARAASPARRRRSRPTTFSGRRASTTSPPADTSWRRPGPRAGSSGPTARTSRAPSRRSSASRRKPTRRRSTRRARSSPPAPATRATSRRRWS